MSTLSFNFNIPTKKNSTGNSIKERIEKFEAEKAENLKLMQGRYKELKAMGKEFVDAVHVDLGVDVWDLKERKGYITQNSREGKKVFGFGTTYKFGKFELMFRSPYTIKYTDEGSFNIPNIEKVEVVLYGMNRYSYISIDQAETIYRITDYSQLGEILNKEYTRAVMDSLKIQS